MRSFRSLNLLSWTLWLVAATAHAEPAAELELGATYAGPQALAASSLGITLSLASGWQASLAEDGRSVLLSSADGGGHMIMLADAFTRASAQASMSAPMRLPSGLVFSPTTAVRALGNTFSADYLVSGMSEPLRGRVVTVIGSYGIGATVIAVATQRAAAYTFASASALAASLRFAAPTHAASEPPPGAALPPPVDPPASSLAGLKLIRIVNGSGYTEQTTIHLCRDGSFRRHDYFNSSSINGSLVNANDSAGRWQHSGDELRLHYDDGKEASFTVEATAQKLTLNGRQWIRENGGC